MIISRYIHVAADGIISFFFMLIFHCIFHIFIHSPVDGHLGCFHILVIEKSVAMNSGVRVSFRIMVFLEYMHRNGPVGS